MNHMRSLAFAIVFLVLASPVDAAESKWTIALFGLTRVWEDFDNPELREEQIVNGSGYFTGFDANRDGALTFAEISALNVLGYEHWDDDAHQHLPVFHFTQATGLSISFNGYRTTLEFGEHMTHSAPGFSLRYIWTTDTVTLIEGPSLVVPEASTTLMLPVGLAACLLWRRRVRVAAGPATERGSD